MKRGKAVVVLTVLGCLSISLLWAQGPQMQEQQRKA